MYSKTPLGHTNFTFNKVKAVEVDKGQGNQTENLLSQKKSHI